MESTEYTLDGLLCQSILLFYQSRFYDTCRESETEAFQLLEQARLVMQDTKAVLIWPNGDVLSNVSPRSII